MGASKRNYPKQPNGGREATPNKVFFEAVILYIFGYIPTNAYAILAAIVQQEFKHPKFKHPNGNPELFREWGGQEKRSRGSLEPIRATCMSNEPASTHIQMHA